MLPLYEHLAPSTKCARHVPRKDGADCGCATLLSTPRPTVGCDCPSCTGLSQHVGDGDPTAPRVRAWGSSGQLGACGNQGACRLSLGEPRSSWGTVWPLWGSATVLPSTAKYKSLLRFKPLPVKDHYVVYCDSEVQGQVVHEAKLIGRDKSKSQESLAAFKNEVSANGSNPENIIFPRQIAACPEDEQ
ncbi:odorant-binding protein 2b isoform X1 [Pteropus medius]|uniref:odorant-binding protein 2b isoform X1 n=1 Tax=Pteropus vampyrus TaxID=132908 RepID=UPI00196A941E|nr:odorant-binding protein 2b isoform X1 [Pteropus giganteus]